jgi:hypothetical protein
MKYKLKAVLFCIWVIGLLSCSKDSGIPTSTVDNFLPGKWEITKIELKKSGYIPRDTTIEKAGTLFIPKFSSERTLLNAKNKEVVKFTINTNGIEYQVRLDYMVLHSTIFMALRSEMDMSVYEKLPRYWVDAYVFRNNYSSEIVNENQWLIKDPSDNEIRIHLTRIK